MSKNKSDEEDEYFKEEELKVEVKDDLPLPKYENPRETPDDRFREVITPKAKISKREIKRNQAILRAMTRPEDTTQLDDIKENSKKHSKALNALLTDMFTTFVLVSVFALKDSMPFYSWLLLIVTLLSSKIITYVRILLTGEVQEAKDEARDKEIDWMKRELALEKAKNDLKKDLERSEAVKEWELKAVVRQAVILTSELDKVYDLDDLR